jgi:hypothetical protein
MGAAGFNHNVRTGEKSRLISSLSVSGNFFG